MKIGSIVSTLAGNKHTYVHKLVNTISSFYISSRVIIIVRKNLNGSQNFKILLYRYLRII